MYSREFMAELGAFIRSLEAEIRQHPGLPHSDERDVIENLDHAIIALIATRMKVWRSLQQK